MTSWVSPLYSRFKSKDPEVRVQLQADDGVNYGEVARVMASIEWAGITRLSVSAAR